MQDNNVAYFADGQINGLLHSFFTHAGLDSESTKFTLMPRANRREVEKLLRAGVKSIDLGFSDFATSAGQLAAQYENSSWADTFSAIVSPISNALSSTRTAADAQAAASIDARMTLSFDGRSAGNYTPELMGAIAANIYAEDSSDFKIVTKHDVVITRDKLVVKMEVNVEGDDISTAPDSAFENLRHALNQWRENGLFTDD